MPYIWLAIGPKNQHETIILLCISNKFNNVHAADEFVQTLYSMAAAQRMEIMAIQPHVVTDTQTPWGREKEWDENKKVKTRPRFRNSKQ